MNTLTQILFVAAGLAMQAQAHTHLIEPASRLTEKFGFPISTEDGTGHHELLCSYGQGKPTCCSSEAMKQQKTYQRGDEVKTSWWRNNHVGGFVRYSIVNQDKSNSQEAFDAAENMLSYECNQVGCDATFGGSSPNNWNGGDSQGSKGWSNACSGGFKIPFHLEDGAYTVQWIWFAQGNPDKGGANSPFQGCVDLQIKGGDSGEKPACPLWKGGDLSEAGEGVCSYIAVDNPTFQGVCKDANACKGRYAVGVPEGLEQCLAGSPPKSFPLGMVESKEGAPDTYTNYSASGSAPAGSSKSSKNASKSSSSSGSSLSSDSSSSSSANDVDSAYVAPKASKKKCSNKERSMLVKSNTKRMHYGKRAPSRTGRAVRHVKRNLKTALAL